MKIKRQELVKALQTIKPGLAAKELIEQSTHVVFKDGVMYSYNDEISVQCAFDAGIQGAVPMASLAAYVGKLQKDEIEVFIEGTELRIKAGRSRAGFTISKEIKLPYDSLQIGRKWQDIPDGLLAALKHCRSIVSNDMSTPVMTCLHIAGNEVQATDRYRIIRYEFAGSDMDILIPGHTITALLSFNPTHCQIKDEWSHWKNKDNAIMSIRLFTGKFPDISMFMGKKGASFKLPANIITVLEKADSISNGLSNVDELITINLRSSKLKLSIHNEQGWFEESAKVSYDGDAIEFQIAIFLLQEILKSTQTGQIADNNLIFKNKDWEYVTSCVISK